MTAFLNIKVSRWSNCTKMDMAQKDIFRFNSIKSVRSAAWLAFAFLAVGALGNSVQAQTPWLDENLNSLTEGSALAVGGKCVAVGTAGYATGATGGGAVRFFKAAAISGTDARWSLSDSYATARPSGYITFKIQQTPGVTASAAGYMTFRLGANDANNLSSGAAAWFEARFFNQPYVSSGVTSANANLMTYLGAAGSKIQNNSINNGSSPVKIEIWYNNTSSPMNYTSPATQGTVALSANSFVIYAGNALVTATATGSAIVPSVTTSTGVTATSIGKIGFVVGTAQSCDFIVDDIYAADSAPVVSVPFAINSATTATVQARSNFSYTITTSGGTATSYDATGLPSYLSINTATGVISGAVPASTPATTTPISIGLSATGASTVTANLALTVTAASSDFAWNNTSTVWNNATSWTNNAVPANSASTDIAAFGNVGGSPTSVDVGTGRSIGGIVFNSGAYAYTWTGTDITVGNVGGITNNSGAIQTFGNKVINSSGSATWSSVSGGSMVFNGGIDLTTSSSTSSRILTFAGAGNVAVSGAIANGGTATAGGVIFSSTGVNLLSGNNSYGGTTTISSGATLKIGSANALGSASGNTVVSSGGVLDLNGQTISGEPLSLAGTGISSGGALINNGITDASWGGTVALVNSATYINASAGKKITLSGAVSGDAKGIYKLGSGILDLSGANTFTGTSRVVEGTMLLSGVNSATGYLVGAIVDNISPVLKVSATNAMSPLASLTGSSGSARVGSLDLSVADNYALNQYLGGNLNLTNSSGSVATLTFTNADNIFSSGGGRTFANQSTNLTVTFLGQLDIAGDTNASCTLEATGPVVISNRVHNSTTNFTRNLVKTGTGTLTIHGTNSYNGSTLVTRGSLVIPAVGSLVNCSNTVVSSTSSSSPASLNLVGAAGVVQVSTNGFVRGGGPITSLQVQDAGTVEVAVGTTWITGGTIDFAAGSKVSVTGTPTAGNTYTLMTASSAITGSIPTLEGVTDWQLDVEGTELKLKQVQLADGFSQLFPGTAFDAVVNGSKVGLQYAFGSPTGMPLNNGVTAVPVMSGNQLTYTFDVKEDSALQITYETSTDLVNWDPPQNVTPGSGITPSGFVKKQAQATGSGKLFIRINVTR